MEVTVLACAYIDLSLIGDRRTPDTDPDPVTLRANHGKSGALDFAIISGLS